MDESGLVQAAQAGDREAFSALVRLHQERLRGLAALSLPVRDDVHDVVQEAFLDAWRGLPGFEAGREFGPWLRTLCRNRVARHLRDRLPRRRRELALVDAALAEVPPLDDDGGEAQRVQALRACLDGLDPAQRDLLTRRYHDEQPVQDIANALGRSPNAVSMVLLRLKAALQRCLERRLAGTTP